MSFQTQFQNFVCKKERKEKSHARPQWTDYTTAIQLIKLTQFMSRG